MERMSEAIPTQSVSLFPHPAEVRNCAWCKGPIIEFKSEFKPKSKKNDCVPICFMDCRSRPPASDLINYHYFHYRCYVTGFEPARRHYITYKFGRDDGEGVNFTYNWERNNYARLFPK